jgi:polyhydroxybutyrate depolymerase
MKRSRLLVLLFSFAMSWIVSNCSRSDLDAISRSAADAAGGTADVADAPPVADTADAPPVADTADAPPVADTADAPPVADTADAPPVADTADAAPVADTADAPPVADTADATSCPTTVLPSGETTQTVLVGGVSRTYALHVPSTYDGKRAVPLVLDFHAIGGTGKGEKTGSPYPAQTDPEGVIMAFPNGLNGPLGAAWNVGPCCVSPVNGVPVDDVGFAKKIVEQLKSMACIDVRRVYAVGTSMGGGMAYYLACRSADVFAAIAPSAFDLMEQQLPDCNPTRPITVVSFRGTIDNVVPYDGSPSVITVPGMPVTFLGAQDTFAEWASLDQCTGTPSPEDSNGCASYTSCEGGVEVILCTKPGGGQDVGNAAYAWPILKRHTL